MIHKRTIKMSTIRLSQLQYYMANKVEWSSEEWSSQLWTSDIERHILAYFFNLPSHWVAFPVQYTWFAPEVLLQLLTTDPFSLNPLLHWKWQMLPYTLLHAIDISLPLAGGRRTGHLRTEWGSIVTGLNKYCNVKGMLNVDGIITRNACVAEPRGARWEVH